MNSSETIEKSFIVERYNQIKQYFKDKFKKVYKKKKHKKSDNNILD